MAATTGSATLLDPVSQYDNPMPDLLSAVEAPGASGRVLTVGPGMMFANISLAIAAAQNGDTIAVLAGTYVDASNYTDNNVIHASNVTIVGIGGMVHLEMGPQGIANGKALIVAEAGLTIKNFELSGMTDGTIDGNLAGIRLEGGNLTVENCYIHNGQEGILAPITGGTVTIDHSEFGFLGSGDGYSHGIYIGDATTLTITNSYFHDAVVGHEIKSRAQNTIIENNVIADLNGTASYDIDIPNAGNVTITNNIIEKGPNASNAAVIHYGGETQWNNPTTSVNITNNTIISNLPNAWVVWNQSAVNDVTVPVNLSDNQLYGFAASNISTGLVDASGNTTLATDPTLPVPLTWQGAPIVELPTGPQTLALVNTGETVTGGASVLTINDSAGGNVLNSGTGAGIIANVTAINDVINTSAGTSNTISIVGRSNVNSAGNDTIAVAGEYNAVTVSGSAVVNQAASGWGTFVVDGTATLNLLAGGQVTVGGAGKVIAALGANTLFTKAAGGTISLSEGGSAPMSLAGGAMSVNAMMGTIQITDSDAAADSVTFGKVNASVTGGTGADTYVFVAGDDSNDTISGFKQGTDSLVFKGFTGNAVASAKASSGSTILTLSDGTQVTVANVLLSQYITTPATTSTPSSPTTSGAGSGSGSGTVALTTRGNTVVGTTTKLTLTDSAGGNTVTGGAGGLAATVSGSGDVISTKAGATDTLNIVGSDTVSSAGTDTIVATGIYNVITTTGRSSVSLTSRNNTVTGGAGLLTVSDAFGSNVLTGGAGGMDATVGGAYSSLTTAAGSSNVLLVSGKDSVASAGHDAIAVAGGYNSVVATGAATITGAAGSWGSFVLDGAGETLNTAAGGAVTVGAAAVATIVDGSAGTLAVVKQAGGQVSVQQAQTSGATAQATVSGSAATISGGSGGLQVTTAGQGKTQVTLGSGSVAVTASGVDTIAAGSGNASVTGGASFVQVQGGSGTLLVKAGTGGASVVAGAGNVTLNGGGGADSFKLGKGAALFDGGAGAETVYLGAGAASLVGGTGTDSYVAVAGQGGGSDTVRGFRAGIDHFSTQGYAAGAVTSETVSAGNTVVALSDGTRITFLGVTSLT